jgi:hypothetical protein
MEDVIMPWIPIIAILSTIALPLCIVLVAVVLYHKKKVAAYKAIEKAIDSNASPEVIEQLVALSGQAKEPQPIQSRKKYAIEGLSLLAVGLSLLVFYMVQQFVWILLPAVLLVMLGLARLIVAVFIVKDDKGESE